MTLKEYLSKKKHTQKKLASKISEIPGAASVTQGAISQWLEKGIPAERVVQIEIATNGQVSRYELRPDLYAQEELKTA